MNERIPNKAKFQEIFQLIKGGADIDIEMAIFKVLNNFSIEDLWIEDNVAFSYWLYIGNNLHEKFEIELIKDLLFWKELYTKSNVKIKCISSAESKIYNFCIDHFNLSSLPCLIFANSPEFNKPHLLTMKELQQIKRNSVLSTLNQLHSLMLPGRKDINESDLHKLLHSKKDLQSIKTLVGKGDLAQSFIILDEILEDDAELGKYLILLKGKHQNAINSKLSGTIKPDEYNLEIANVSASLLTLIDKAEAK